MLQIRNKDRWQYDHHTSKQNDDTMCITKASWRSYQQNQSTLHTKQLMNPSKDMQSRSNDI